MATNTRVEGKVRAHVDVNPWVVTISVMLATFMELLDTTVVNVSIPHIAGNLGADVDEGTWVVTSYLVSNAIILPMAGWLANHFGRRKVMMFCVAGFTITSFCCGAATSLTELIVFRVLQGLTGGGMQPLSQAVMLETFPKEKHGHAMAAYSVGILMAPIFGPVIGGWITDEYTWRWIFYLNIPIGILSLFLTNAFVFDPPYIKRREGPVDVWGIGALALGLGTLQIVLDNGQKKDWFASGEIRILSVICAAGLLAMVVRELTTEHPIVDLRALKETTFAVGVFLISVIGFVLYASMVMLPIYLQTLLGYPALNAGLALAPRGFGSLITAPLSGYLTNKVAPHKLIMVGLTLGAATMYRLSRLSLDAGYWDIFWPQVIQGMALNLMFIPNMAASMSRIPKEKMGNATSIFNLTRNIGGSFGIAVMTTFISRRTQFHQNRLIEHFTDYDLTTRQYIEGVRRSMQAHGSDAVTATQQALAGLYGMLQRHASMLSFVEAFWVLCVLFALLLPITALLRRPPAHPVEEEPHGLNRSGTVSSNEEHPVAAGELLH